MAHTNLKLNTKEESEGTCFKSPARGYFVPLVVAFVGLPARGKTVLAHKLERFLNYTGHQARVFSLSCYRRKVAPNLSYDIIFDPDSSEAAEIRKQFTQEAISDCKQWIFYGGDVAVCKKLCLHFL
ncbi:hypothetical protein O3M35_008609 [Rhynocoris fuscipes]|uniref:6-phosphofructo-2-kinase domain-containing protein n=1 Tax=Rhynocoris fuscipes TaxID=488301 RepID=A0AAW1DEA1_9HEMI